MKKFFLVLLSLSIFLSISAQNETSYEVDAFHAIDVQDNFKVYLSQGNEYTVTAHVPEGYGEFMSIEVKSGKLILALKDKNGKNKSTWTWRNNSVSIQSDNNRGKYKEASKIEIYVTFPSIDALAAGGVSEIIGLTPLTLKDFKLEVSGAAETKLNLNTNNINVDQSGASKAELTMAANHISFNLSGSTKNYIQFNQAAKSVNVDLSGASYLEMGNNGNVDVLKIDVSGAAQINAPTLNASKVMVICSGASKVYVGKVEKLMVDGSGASSVKYQESELKTEISFEKSGAASITTY
ncbi:MAG: DUF2807 domain-containing protein [Chitinophagales bacterium]